MPGSFSLWLGLLLRFGGSQGWTVMQCDGPILQRADSSKSSPRETLVGHLHSQSRCTHTLHMVIINASLQSKQQKVTRKPRIITTHWAHMKHYVKERVKDRVWAPAACFLSHVTSDTMLPPKACSHHHNSCCLKGVVHLPWCSARPHSSSFSQALPWYLPSLLVETLDGPSEEEFKKMREQVTWGYKL